VVTGYSAVKYTIDRRLAAWLKKSCGSGGVKIEEANERRKLTLGVGRKLGEETIEMARGRGGFRLTASAETFSKAASS